MFFLEFAIVLIVMLIGAQYGGIFFGMAGGVGLAVLVFVFKLAPASPPIAVMLIILSVVVAASTLEAAGGMQVLIKKAEALLRKNPSRITFFSPLIAWVFTFMSGTGNVLYNVLPVIAEVAREAKIRPERPISIAVIASQHAVVASPISAATVALASMLAPQGVTLTQIMVIAIPATLIGIMAGALVVNRMGRELEDDPVYLEKMAKGLIPVLTAQEQGAIANTKEAKLSVVIFLIGAVLVVLLGTFSWLRPDVVNAAGKVSKLNMTNAIEIVMLSISALMVVTCKVDVNKIISGSVFKNGMLGVVSVFGLAWMSDTLLVNNMDMIKNSVQEVVKAQPLLFAFALFVASAITHSQGATVAALVPLGIALGVSGLTITAMFPAVCGYFIIPSTGVLLAGVAFDRTGTTKIGKYVVNHSYMVPGLVATIVGVITGFVILRIFF
ncbi:anaerobic C4-dicarboxylate transporter family protein [Sporomusa termitida]|uniref:Anaerobic C4-dicarboxylate transporter DcuA n=1 Tax=Sporomusa termitida TaxID=2377 RepID=A0A517DR21_9FIRM|nr:anaerobic C4-dicarboxylate transporter [Sporomusa termitida]QDR79791.1 Anaerobic C4-dicarboxylate transporter DcuA [Sporomusa termitida]